MQTKEIFYIFFQGNDKEIDNLTSPKELLDNEDFNLNIHNTIFIA